MLKERLGLPINIREMLYFRCSALSPADLDAAYTSVSNIINNEQAFHEFLINQPGWEAALSEKYPEEFTALKNARNNPNDEREVDYEKLGADFHQGIIALTRRALNK